MDAGSMQYMTIITHSGHLTQLQRFYEILVSYIFDKLYHGASKPASLDRSHADVECFACDSATCMEIEKLQSKKVAMHALSFSILYYTCNKLISTWAEPFEMVKLILNFVADNESHFFDA